MMGKILEFLKGKKSYIIAGAMSLATFLNLINVIDIAALAKIEAFLLPLGLAALRAGIKNK